MDNATSYLKEDGTPNLALLIETFNRCRPALTDGTEWMDNVRFCRWPNQWADGKKHDRSDDPNGAAMPWNGASDCRPFVVDDICNERVAMLTAAFWRAMVTPGSAGSEEEGYAVALVEYLVFTKMVTELNDQVELSAQFQETYGWCMLAPRWRRELGLKRFTLKMTDIVAGAQAAQQQLQNIQQPTSNAQQPIGGMGEPTPSPSQEGNRTGNQMGNQPDQMTALMGLARLPMLIADETLEDDAVQYLREYYDSYVARSLPEDLRERAPKTTDKQARKAVRELRKDGSSTVALPYVCVNAGQILSLKPWTDVFVPPELTNENELVFQAERVTEAELRGRELADDYTPEWVALALTKKGQWISNSLPVGTTQGIGGLLASAPQPLAIQSSTPGDNKTGPIELIHAVYRAPDENGIPSVYCTTFHRDITRGKNGKELVGKHELVDGLHDADLPYTALVKEKWDRSITSSRGVPEMAHTQQNLVKGFLDGLIDRQSITVLPPVNVYENPLDTKYKFGPARQNYCRPGKEPQFMQMPSGQGMSDGLEVHNVIRVNVDNRFAMLSPEVSAPRQQTAQEKAVRRFLISWTRAIQQMLCFYQKYGDDAEFAKVTGADPGWLDAHRDEPGVLGCALEFDVRELDSELNMKRIEAFNTVALPNDINGIYDRVAWAQDMARGILGPRASKRLVRSTAGASTQLQEKAELQVLKMFAGTPPMLLDDKDPTAATLLQMTQQVLMQNPKYLAALDDEALVTVAGQQGAQQLAQQLGDQRRPDERFSALLLKWLENLKFVGVTQVKNKQIGRTGVDPETGNA